jgi:septal ring factor EnvC (AmiA/AmiB activator)
MLLKAVSFLIILITFLSEVKSAQINEAQNVHRNLIQITRQLQNIEGKLNALEDEVRVLMIEEEKALMNVAGHQHNLILVLQSLKHWRDYSPALIAFSTTSSSDLIHSLLALQSVSPQLEKQNRSILEAIKRVAIFRAHLQEKVKQFGLIKSEYQDSLQKQAGLFEVKFKKTDTQDSEFALLQERLKGKENLPPDELITYLQTSSEKDQDQPQNQELILFDAVVGKRVQSCQGAICHDSTEQNLALKIESRPEAQVTSPWDGRVVSLNFVENKGHVVILKKGNFYLVVTGLGSINCRLGEFLHAGEPLGCMPSSSSTAGEQKLAYKSLLSQKQLLTIELHKGTQLIDLTPYLRTNSDDKKV